MVRESKTIAMEPIVIFLLVISSFPLIINGAPTEEVSDSNSLVVTSTTTSEAAKEESTTETSMDNGLPIVPKIYEMKVDTNVTNRFATTLITSKVRNLAKSAQEATFSVVLPETAYISGFAMEIDDKTYQAYVKEKQEAKQIYQNAVEGGLGAAHVEANVRDSNRFTVSVNVEPQSKAIFKLNYEQLLQRQNEKYEIVINIHPGQPVKDLNVKVTINETRPLKFVRAPSLRSGNEISKNDEKLDPQAEIEVINATSAVVHFSPDLERQKQLANGLGTKEENGLAGQFVVQYEVERDPHGGEVLVKDGYFVHFFAPSDLKALPKQVVFVLDTSGSMDGNRIQQLKEAMNSILAELKSEDVFNIVEFSSVVKVWNIETVEVVYQLGSDPWAVYNIEEENAKENKTSNETLPSAYEATEANIKKASEVVGKLNAYGGTDIKSALEVGLKLVKQHKEEKSSNTHQPIIIFLTDGEPTVGETNQDKIISSIKEANAGEIQSPIFSLSFGDGADRDFLQKISLKNLGFARHIYEAADASLQLQEFYKQISSPLLSNVTFEYVSNITNNLTKTNFPILFHGCELVIAGETSSDEDFAPARIVGWGRHGPIDLVPAVRQHSVGALERLWAYLTLKQVLEARDAADDKTKYTKKALDLALEYSFVTPVSSLVVVKPNDTKAVDTEDASRPGGDDRPSFSYKSSPQHLSLRSGLFSASALSAVPLSGNSGFLAQPVAFGKKADTFMFAEVESDYDFSQNAEIATTNIPEDITNLPEDITNLPDDIANVTIDEYNHLKTVLPWLGNILLENGTLTSPPGGYKLGVAETIDKYPDCPKTPINGTTSGGVCSLLPNCPQVYPTLTSEQVFIEHICFMEKIAGICCPKTV